jgi:hypothetical protein
MCFLLHKNARKMECGNPAASKRLQKESNTVKTTEGWICPRPDELYFHSTYCDVSSLVFLPGVGFYR